MDVAGSTADGILRQSKDIQPSSQLDGFVKLGEQIFYHRPVQQTSCLKPDYHAPDLILLCSWLYAQNRHIAKYTTPYQRLYPSSPILILRQDGPDLIWRPNAWQMENMKPAISIIKGIEATKGRSPQILMHMWSNGGAFTACQLADAYTLQAEAQLLPISGLIIDSAPGIQTFSTGYTALSQGIPNSLPAPLRAIGGALLYSSLLALSAFSKILGSEGVISGTRRKLNDPEGAFIIPNLQRIYIYSTTDQLVSFEHVEKHAREARDICEARTAGSGQALVRLERFEGTRHVAHAAGDAERYWQIVADLWSSMKI